MKIQTNYPLSKETTFKCGGMAKWYVEVEDLTEFYNILNFHTGNKYILGGGSKTLCNDDGYDGLVISTKKLNKIQLKGNIIECESGVKLEDLHNFCLQNELSGIEWSMGIPASIGGAVCMNMGAFGKDISEFVEYVEVLIDKKRQVLYKKDIQFDYRKSSLKNIPIFKVALKLAKYKKNDIIKQQQYFFNKKLNAQPLCYGSCGSIFKRSGNIIPAKLIEDLKLKGKKFGGAEISNKHSGFIINTGSATATDIITLITDIETTAQKQNIKLEREIIII